MALKRFRSMQLSAFEFERISAQGWLMEQEKIMRSESEIMDLILNAARADERIRAVLLAGSRANPAVPRDRYKVSHGMNSPMSCVC